MDRHGIRPHVRLETEVLGATWDDEPAAGPCGSGPPTALTDVLGPGRSSRRSASSTGRTSPRSPARTPSPGRPSTRPAGTTSVDLAGKRVAMIGAGASGFQIAPTIAPTSRS